MAKAKNKRNSGLADKVNSKRKGDVHKKKLNPFEVHINKEKIKVLGKKSKHDRGLPGVSRSKAMKKRRDVIGTEIRMDATANAFLDRRIGEKDGQLTSDDRMVARFTAERARQHSKKNIFNLADDEILTHRGQTLEQIEKFDDPRSSDDEEDGVGKKYGGLEDDFVSEGHFGGGMLSRTEKDGAKSHQDLIEKLIAESKKRKAEKQKEKEQTLDLTEKLDSEWKDLQPVVFKRAREEESIIDKVLSQADKKNADYDKMMRELKFEKRGTPSDGIKTDEKQAKEEKLKLEELEKERLMRMYDEGDVTAAKVIKPTPHRSADDLDDNFAIEDDEKRFMLAYDVEGAMPLEKPEDRRAASMVQDARKMIYNDGISDTSSEEDSNEESSEEESDDEENKDEDDKVEDKSGNSEQKVQSEKEVKVRGDVSVEETESSDDGDDESENEEKTVNKQKNDSIKEDQNKKDTKKSVKEVKNSKVTEIKKDLDEDTILFKNVVNDNESDKEDSGEESGDEESDEEESSEKEDTKPKDDFADLKESDVEENCDEETAQEDALKIGSFFDLQDGEGENLKELLKDKTPSQQSTAVQKLIKSYDPSLSENNKEKLSRLFAHLLEYINDIFTDLDNEGDVIKAFLIFDKLAPYLYDLAHTNKVAAKKYIVTVLKDKHDRFQRNIKKVPDLDTLIFFKLVSLLYPTSDFKHPVTSPSLLFMSEILRFSKFQTRYAISRGFFVTALILEYTALSKRYVPSSVNYLRGILYSCANTSILNPIQVVPPFRIHRDSKTLQLENDNSKMDVGNKMAAKDLVLEGIDDDFKIRCLQTSTLMLKEFFDNFNELEAQACMFEPHLQLYARIDLELYPKKVVSVVNETLKYVKEKLEVKTFTTLTKERQAPKLLRLYEPEYQEVFTDGKNSKLSRELASRRRTLNKIKNERKGAIREIRRDRAYIVNMRIRKRIQSDNIRKDKVKQIYKDAAIQQGELNKLKRMK